MRFAHRPAGQQLILKRLTALMATAFFITSIPLLLHFNHKLAIDGLPDTAPRNVPDGVVYQSTSYSCGPASLAGVLRYYGIIKSERELAELAGTGVASGTQLTGLVDAAQTFGFEALVLDPTYEQLDLIRHPSIIFQSKFYHLVTFWGLDQEGKLIIRDPALGPIRWEASQYRENAPTHPILLLLYPGRAPRCSETSAPIMIARFQNMLRDLGLYRGGRDAKWNDDLIDSVRSFQRSMSLPDLEAVS